MKKIICIGTLIAAVTGSYWYTSRAEIKRPEKEYTNSRAEIKRPEKEYTIKLAPGAREYVETGMSRMKLAGARYTPLQLKWILRDADENKDNTLDRIEAGDLYETVLNPEAPLGRLALPAERIPENPTALQYSAPVSKKWKHAAAVLMDENKDGKVTEQEISRGFYRLEREVEK